METKANEYDIGALVCPVPLMDHKLARDAVVIGKVVRDHPGMAALRTSIGSTRILDLLSGEQLPQIC